MTPRILLVEDEAITARLTENTIKKFGYEVTVASSGEEAIDVACAQPFNLILMDIDLGDGIDGTVAAEEILKCINLPILFHTSHTEEEYVERVKQITRYGYVVKNSGAFVLKSSIEMALELFEAHHTTKESRNSLEQAEEIAGFGSWVFNMDTGLVTASLGARAIYGLTKDVITIPEAQAIPKEEYREMLDNALKDLIEKGTPYNLMFEITHGHTGETRVIHSVAKYNSHDRKVTGTIHDITEEEEARLTLKSQNEELEVTNEELEATNEELQASNEELVRALQDLEEHERLRSESEKRFSLLFEYANDAIIVADAETGKIAEANKKAEELTGRPLSELLEMYHWQLHPQETHDDVVASFQSIEERVNRKHRNKYILHSSGEWIPVEISPTIMILHNTRYAVGIFRDITERVKSEKRIEGLLQEKELLLKEVHHRIKNNMATIMGILSLQGDAAQDSETASLFQNTENRLRGMMHLYDKLYQSSDFRTLSLKEYLDELIEELEASYSDSRIQWHKEIENHGVDVEILSSIGMILNEATTNAMKYAFKDRKKGDLYISAHKENGHLALTIRDNGLGITLSENNSSASGFGLELMRLLTSQEGGEMTIEKKEGTTLVFRFPLTPAQ